MSWNWGGGFPWWNRNQAPPLYNNTNMERDPNAYDDPNIPPNVPGQPPGIVVYTNQQAPFNPGGPVNDPQVPLQTPPYGQPPRPQFFSPIIAIIIIVLLVIIVAWVIELEWPLISKFTY